MEEISMYLRTHERLGQPAHAGNCPGWERDRQSFSKVIAEYYIRTELGLSLTAKSIWCGDDGKICEVTFPDGITVMVSFVKMPDYVIARQRGPSTPRREYQYYCTLEGKVILTPRNKPTTTQPSGSRTRYQHSIRGLGQPPVPPPAPKTSSDSESQMIQDAIGRGLRDEKALTDLIFFARHPERRGRKLRKGETDFNRLSEEWGLILGCLVRPALRAVTLPPELQQFLDQVRQRPEDYEKLLLTIAFHPNPLQAFFDSLQGVRPFTQDSITQSSNPEAVIEIAVIHLVCIGQDHSRRNASYNRQIQEEIQIRKRLLDAVNKLGLRKLEPYLIDALLVSDPLLLWQVGMDLSQNALPPGLSRQVFESRIAESHYAELGKSLRQFAEQFQQADSAFRRRVEQERRRREQSRQRQRRDPGRRPQRGQVPV
jgi:hypothetical protein